MAQFCRVIGPPGTGKTTWIQRFIADLPHRQLLLASHTRTAARVLAHRIDDVDSEAIGTLHSHAYRALGRPPVAEAGKLAQKWDENVQPDWRINSTGKRDVNSPYEFDASETDNMFTRLQRWRAFNGDAEPPPYLRRIAQAWTQFKLENDAVDFHDMLLLTVRRRLPPPNRPRTIVVDEAQDLTPAGWALVRHWAQYVDEVVVAGDPAQAIYEWAGASPEPLLEDGWDELVLDRSYRLPFAVHQFAERLLLRHSGNITRNRWYRPRDVDGKVAWSDLSLRDAPQLVRMLQQTPGTVMLLTSCAYMLNGVLKMLREFGVPFWNPYRRAEARWNPLKLDAGEGRTSTVARVLAFLRPSSEVWGDDARLWLPEDFAVWLRMLKADQFVGTGTRDKLLANPQQLDIDTVADSLRPEARNGMSDLSLQWLADSVLSEYHATVEFMARIANKNGLRALAENPRIIVGTIHSVKGGEADTVIVSPDLSLQGFASLSERAGIDATIRLFYTAVTRAKEKLVILQPSTKLSYTF